MKYYIPSKGIFVDNSRDVVIEGVTYPRNTVDGFFDDAVAAPPAKQFETVQEGPDGWTVVPWPQEDIDAHNAAVTESLVARVWQERYNIANHPMYGLDPAGAVKVATLAEAGLPKAVAIVGWVQALYDEAVTKEFAIRAGATEVGEWTTPQEKPYSVSEVMAEAV